MDADKSLDEIVQEERASSATRRGGRVSRGGPGSAGRGASRGGRGAMSARSAVAAGQALRPPRVRTTGPVLRNRTAPPSSAPYFRRNMPAEGSKTIKVAAASAPKTVAGSIAHSTREGESPVVLCRGVDATNQTIKAIAIARSYLAGDNFDLRAQIEFQSRDSPEATITINRIVRPAAELGVEELNVKKDSDPYKVAGALAGRVRDSKRVSIIGLGPDAVFRCVETVAIARRYLSENGLDLTFAPEFFAMQSSDGTELSALRFQVFSSQV